MAELLISAPYTESDWPHGKTAAIAAYLADHLAPYTCIGSKIAFVDTAIHLADHINEVIALLTKQDISTHQYLWFFAACELARVAEAVAEARARFADSSDSRLANAVKMLKTPLHDSVNTVIRFLPRWNMAILKGKAGAEAQKLSAMYIGLVLLICNAVVAGHAVLDGAADMTVVAESLVTFSYVYNTNSRELALRVFPALVGVAKASFFVGQPQAVVLLAFGSDLVSESTPTTILARLKPDFHHIMDFYRYYGYCFVTLAVVGSAIDQKYSDLADVFLRVLLGLPNLQLSNYFSPASPAGQLSLPKLYFSDTDREELSFFFLLNTLLNYTSLDQYVRGDSEIRAEMLYFTTQFNGRVLKDLALLASPSQSYSNSLISVPSLEHRIFTPSPVANSKTLSSILSEGTYKEKVNLVLQFFKISGSAHLLGPAHKSAWNSLISFVQIFNLCNNPGTLGLTTKIRNSDVTHCVSYIDREKYPGKALFVHAIDKSVRLMQLLSLLHLSETAGLSSDPDSMISRLFNTGYTFNDIAGVKDLAGVDPDGTFCRKFGNELLEDDQIAAQYKILQRTKRLEECVQRIP